MHERILSAASRELPLSLRIAGFGQTQRGALMVGCSPAGRRRPCELAIRILSSLSCYLSLVSSEFELPETRIIVSRTAIRILRYHSL